MRVGTAIFLPLLALFGFGFSLAYSLNLSQDLIETRQQLAQLQAQSQALGAQYQAVLEERNRLTGQVSELIGENEELRQHVQALEIEQSQLIRQIETLQVQFTVAEKVSPIFGWLASDATRQASLAFLVVPLVPLSVGAAYFMTRRKETTPSRHRASRLEPHSSTFQGMLTREEFHLIAQFRRLRYGG